MTFKKAILKYILSAMISTAMFNIAKSAATVSENTFINAHGGGVLFYQGRYYWYGEIKNGETRKVPNATWENYRVDAGGVSCYSSINLKEWKFERVVLKVNKKDTANDLHFSKVIERPKVIYNKKTGKFVMWMHIDSQDYSYARSGVAISDSPTGEFSYIKSVRPNGNMARDMTVYVDDDGKAYHFYSSEDNTTMHITLLSDDYLSHTAIDKRILVNASREAPAVIKHNKKYYLFTSGCTGWAPNEASYAVADSIMGNWVQYGNPCIGPDADKTYYGQGTFILKIAGADHKYVFMADKWNKLDLKKSEYLWLSLTFDETGKPIISNKKN